jgi:hypothetical protein
VWSLVSRPERITEIEGDLKEEEHGKNYIMRNLKICTAKYQGERIKEDDLAAPWNENPSSVSKNEKIPKLSNAFSYSSVISFSCTSEFLKNVVFWDVAPCRSCELNRRFGGTCCLHLQGRKIRERGTSVSWRQQTDRWFLALALHARNMF